MLRMNEMRCIGKEFGEVPRLESDATRTGRYKSADNVHQHLMGTVLWLSNRTR